MKTCTSAHLFTKSFSDRLLCCRHGRDGQACLVDKNPVHLGSCAADMVVMGRRKYDVAQLSGVVDALGKMHYENDVILDRLCQHILDKLPDAGARDLVQLVRPGSDMLLAWCDSRAALPSHMMGRASTAWTGCLLPARCHAAGAYEQTGSAGKLRPSAQCVWRTEGAYASIPL